MSDSENKDVLIVVSKLKAHVKDKYGLSTSGAVPEVITSAVEAICARAAENAKKDGRKTLMDRDFEFTKTEEGSCC